MDPAALSSLNVENQRVICLFLFLQGNSAAQIHRDLVKVLHREALSERTVQYWCARFRTGNFDLTEHRGGDHTSELITEQRIEAVNGAFEESRAWTVRALAANLGIPRSTCYRIITEKLKMKKICKKWVPYELTPAQVETRVCYSKLNLMLYSQQKDRLQHTVAIDETWVNFNRPLERDQLKEWRKPGEKAGTSPQPARFGPKLMLILAMDVNGICYYELLAEKEKVNGPRYLEFLQKLMSRWRRTRRHTVCVIDDNAKPHRTRPMDAWMEHNKIERWHQPPYSPDLSPCDYGCFHSLKRAIGGQLYSTVDVLKEALNREITYGNQNGTYTAVQRLPERWERCVMNKGEYI